MGFLKCHSSTDTLLRESFLKAHEDHFHGPAPPPRARPQFEKWCVLEKALLNLHFGNSGSHPASTTVQPGRYCCITCKIKEARSGLPETTNPDVAGSWPKWVPQPGERPWLAVTWLQVTAARGIGRRSLSSSSDFLRGAWHSYLYAKIYWFKVLEMNTTMRVLEWPWPCLLSQWGTGRTKQKHLCQPQPWLENDQVETLNKIKSSQATSYQGAP